MTESRTVFSCALLALVAFALPAFAAAQAQSGHDRTHFGHNITIDTDEQVSEATCFGCSIRVRGHVEGDVTAFAGSVTVEGDGEVGGDATVFGGAMRLEKTAKISGDVTVFGGRITRDPSASIGGDVTNFGNPVWVVLIFILPLAVLGGFIALIVWLIRRLLRSSLPATA